MGKILSKPQTLITGDVSQYERNKVTPAALGQVLILRCGNEAQWPSNTPAQKRDREFLQKGISFIPEAIEEGADLQNTAFIFCFPGEDFTVTSGNHDWEFIFFIENGDIRVKCTRVPTRRWLWNVIRQCWNRLVDYGRNFAYQALTGRSYVAENALTEGVRCPNCSELNSSSACFCSGCGSSLS